MILIAEARTRPIKFSYFEVGAPAKANYFIFFLKPNLIVKSIQKEKNV